MPLIGCFQSTNQKAMLARHVIVHQVSQGQSDSNPFFCLTAIKSDDRTRLEDNLKEINQFDDLNKFAYHSISWLKTATSSRNVGKL